MDTSIIPLAEAAGIRVGERVNVLLFEEGGHQRMEVLTDVRVKTEKSVDWLVLEWIPGAITPWGSESCGHGGWVIDDALKDHLKEMAVDGLSGRNERSS